jgi:uncharacterized protein
VPWQNEEVRHTMSENRLQIFEPEMGGNTGPAWLREALDDFRIHVLQLAYPCNFGRRALEKRELYMTWVDPDDPSTLPGDVATFLDLTQTDRLGREPIAVFVKPTPERRTHLEHDETFWSILQYLHDHDDRPWPEHVPQDPDEEGWMFSFHGIEMFVFALVPTNRLRRSRYAGDCLVIMLLPKSVFAGIEVGTPAGNAARIGIRKRLQEWDPVEFHPSIGELDVMSQEEWRQYFLPDDSSDIHDTCPITHRGARVMQEQT